MLGRNHGRESASAVALVNALLPGLLMILTVMAVFVTDLGTINAVGGGAQVIDSFGLYFSNSHCIMYQQAVKQHFSGAQREVQYGSP
jgi:hypothetical protein